MNLAKRPPARTPEGRENQLIALAIDLAEKQLSEGTASSQVISHYLKLGSTRQQLENEKLRQENALLKAKTTAIEAEQDTKEMYEAAIKAMQLYSGQTQEKANDQDFY